MSYRESIFTLRETKTLMLRNAFPAGNIGYLLEHTTLYSGCDQYKISVTLPHDHWAFTQPEEPQKRYVVGDDCDVRDSTGRGKWNIANFTHQVDADEYAEMLNERHASTGNVTVAHR